MNRAARITGICLQGAVLGTLVFLAILKLALVASGARVFRYQGF